MDKKIGLVLGAGGARGFCHIGVLEVLQENNIPIDILTGCSMGAMVGGGFAAGVSVATMRELARKTTNRRVFDLDLFHLKRGGFAGGNRAMKLFKKHAGEKLIENCDIKFSCIAADLAANQVHEFKTGLVWRAVRASMSIPGVFHPVRDSGGVYVDGGVLKRMPIAEARGLGADIVIAVDALGEPAAECETNSVVKVFSRAYEMMDWKTAQFEGKAADILIVPDMGNKSAMQFKNNEVAIQAGREAALKALPEIFRKLGRNAGA